MTHAVKLNPHFDEVDWLDAPIPCRQCGKETVASIAILKAHSSIDCRYCGAVIDLTDPGTRGYLEEFSSAVASLLPNSDETTTKH